MKQNEPVPYGYRHDKITAVALTQSEVVVLKTLLNFQLDQLDPEGNPFDTEVFLRLCQTFQVNVSKDLLREHDLL